MGSLEKKRLPEELIRKLIGLDRLGVAAKLPGGLPGAAGPAPAVNQVPGLGGMGEVAQALQGVQESLARRAPSPGLPAVIPSPAARPEQSRGLADAFTQSLPRDIPAPTGQPQAFNWPPPPVVGAPFQRPDDHRRPGAEGRLEMPRSLPSPTVAYQVMGGLPPSLPSPNPDKAGDERTRSWPEGVRPQRLPRDLPGPAAQSTGRQVLKLPASISGSDGGRAGPEPRGGGVGQEVGGLGEVVAGLRRMVDGLQSLVQKLGEGQKRQATEAPAGNYLPPMGVAFDGQHLDEFPAASPSVNVSILGGNHGAGGWSFGSRPGDRANFYEPGRRDPRG